MIHQEYIPEPPRVKDKPVKWSDKVASGPRTAPVSYVTQVKTATEAKWCDTCGQRTVCDH